MGPIEMTKIEIKRKREREIVEERNKGREKEAEDKWK